MAWIRSQIWQKYRILGESSPRSHLLSPPPFSSPSPSSVNGNNYQKSSGSRISPAIIFILVILSVVVFVSGLLHFLLRFLIKHPSSSSVSQSNRYIEMSGSNAFQRQLQQLFHLHDSGLDQALIDTLPVFLYREIMGLIEPFDCAVCLCEFSEQDKLRLLPLCSHAFHVDCIDTWLLSNSSCPLCRGAIFIAGPGIENPVFCSEDTRAEDDFPGNERSVEEEITVEQRVFPVKLGKFRNLNNGGEVGETSSSNSSSLDARRCYSYSIGSYQYMVGNSNLQVALSLDRSGRLDGVKLLKGRDGHIENPSVERDVDGKKFSGGSKGDSFSVSKIWLWSKKAKFSSSLDAYTHMGSPRSLQDGRPYEGI